MNALCCKWEQQNKKRKNEEEEEEEEEVPPPDIKTAKGGFCASRPRVPSTTKNCMI
jgi:hypothetical protein